MIGLPSCIDNNGLMSGYQGMQRTVGEWEQEIGVGLRRMRLDAGYDQSELADRANLSRSAIQSVEGGHGSRLATVVAVLRAMNRLDALDGILPDDGPSPLEMLAQAKRSSRPRRNRKSKS
jgi:transcriptional regulator with XRE-family HTH domain